MPYIFNVKIGSNFVTPSFQQTQFQHFYTEIPQQCAGYSTSLYYMHSHSCQSLCILCSYISIICLSL